jgi:alpha-tubulin suppressor-like RCC1 family protein
VSAGQIASFAVGQDGELLSWGRGEYGSLGHGDTQDQPSPKRVEALRGVRVSSVSAGVSSATYGFNHALALTEDGLVYVWGKKGLFGLSGTPNVSTELLPKPVEALWGVRVVSIAAVQWCSYAVADTGELWVWGRHEPCVEPRCEDRPDCPVPKPLQSLRGLKVVAVATGHGHTLAGADDGSVYAWGGECFATQSGALGLGPIVQHLRGPLRTPQRIPIPHPGALLVACGL